MEGVIRVRLLALYNKIDLIVPDFEKVRRGTVIMTTL
jgi:hypothetical protein